MISIEWLIEQFQKTFSEYIKLNPHWETLEKAKEMHKQEIIDAVLFGDCRGRITTYSTAEQYYQETFASNQTTALNPKKDVQKLGYDREKSLAFLTSQAQEMGLYDVNKVVEDSDYPTTTTDLIDNAIRSLPFDEKIKCWELIEKLIDEETETLYTEEQVRKAYIYGKSMMSPQNFEKYLQSLKKTKNN